MSLRNGTEVAIIGMNCRLPSADNTQTFWANITEGKESISFFGDEILKSKGISDELVDNPNYVKAGFIVKESDQFDARFFGFTPREAQILDPQQRCFLECCWGALENAGYVPSKYDGRIGVFAGVFTSTYLINIYSNPGLVESIGELLVRHGNEKDYLATRVSYKLNLKGPSVGVQTSCSTSLVAVHMAVQSLLSSECDMALSGGVSIIADQEIGYLHQEGGLMSPDGHCRPFDVQAQGTIFGNGLGVVILKRLEDALRDNDTIYSIIKGSAINNDGAGKVGFTAPSVNGQAEVIAEAMAMAEVDASTIGMVEAHGTGTPLGDTIEIEALSKAYNAHTSKRCYCAIGSVKSNIGHLGVASGIVGLIKASLALHHKKIPPTLNFSKPNSNINFDSSPFFVNTELKEWISVKNHPRRASVSSFGMGGTNVHMVLEEAPVFPATSTGDGDLLIVVSAKTETALDRSLEQLGTFLSNHDDISLADAAYTLMYGRESFSYRAAFVANRSLDADQILQYPSHRTLTRARARTLAKPVFLFPGQGSQYPGMCQGLYDSEPVFKQNFDNCCNHLLSLVNVDLHSVLFADDLVDHINQTSIAQSALFSVEYALAKLLQSNGIEPEVMIGHSIGEYVAATLSGVFRLEDALKLVATRGRLMQSIPLGNMLSVSASPEKVSSYLETLTDVVIASVNAPELCVVSGRSETIAQLNHRLKTDGYTTRLLVTSHAFHSPMMQPIVEEYKLLVDSIDKQVPNKPFLSNVTGQWIKTQQATSPQYWANHILAPVLFSPSLELLLDDADHVFIEVGPNTVLTSLVEAHRTNDRQPTVISVSRHPKDTESDSVCFKRALGSLWSHGVTMPWDSIDVLPVGHRIPMPTYPFDHKRYWIDRVSADNKFVFLTPEAPSHLVTVENTNTVSEQLEVQDSKESISKPDVLRNSEETIIRIWKDLFGVDEIAVEADFFELGGTSLVAINMISRIREDLGVELNIEYLFDDPTVCGITAQINSILVNQNDAELEEFLSLTDELSLEEIEDRLSGKTN